MNFQPVTLKLNEGWNYLRRTVGIPVMIVIALTAGHFIYTSFQEWQLKNAIAHQNERLDTYDAASKAANENAQKYLDEQADTAKQSKMMVDVLTGLTANIKVLAENNQTIASRVEALSNNYEKTRYQKSNLPTRAARANVPLRQREDDVLSADRQLYPSGTN